MSGSDGAARDRLDRFERLLISGRAAVSDVGLPEALDLILETARELTGARYAALTVLDDRRSGLGHLRTVGLTEQERTTIAALSSEHGGGGPRFDELKPIRLRGGGEPPCGFDLPPARPPLRGFLGTPIAVRGQAWGSLCLADGQERGDFDDDDLEAVVVLAGWAGAAVDRAQLIDEAALGRRELGRAVATMRTAMEIATAIGGDTDLTRILDLIVERARTLVDADALLIWLRYGEELRIAAVAGEADVPDHAVIPLGASTAGAALRATHPVRVEDARQLPINPAQFGMPKAISALIVPLVHRGRGLGVLMAFDRHGKTAGFDADDERALDAFAASAATAVATARLVEEQRLSDSIAAAESERGRWARELHDETLQGFASLKLTLVAALKAEPDRARTVLASAIEQLEHDMRALHAIITDLRPAALDELGLEPALRTLITGVAEAAGLRARVLIELGAARMTPDVETVAYRVAQEALTNVARHADARSLEVGLKIEAGTLKLVIEDDGRGVEEGHNPGYGLIGMRERATLASGALDVARTSRGGTRVTLELPLL